MTTPTEAVYFVLKNYFNLIDVLSSNYIDAPKAFDDAVWVRSFVLIDPNVSVAPDGTTTADELIDASGNAGYFAQTVTVPDDSATYNPFVYLKKGTASITHLSVSFIGGGSPDQHTIDINWTGAEPVIQNESVSTGATIEAVGNDWYKATLNITNNSSGNTQISMTIYPASKTGASTGTVDAWGAGIFDPYQTQIYNMIMPQDTVMPAIVIQKVAQTRVNTLTDAGGNGVDNMRCRIAIYSDSLSECETISEQCRLALAAATTLKAVQVFNTDNFDDITHLYQVIVDYSIWYRH